MTWYAATCLNSRHSIIVAVDGDTWYRITLDGRIIDEGPLTDPVGSPS